MTHGEFLELCRQTRQEIVEMYLHFDGGHLPSALSLVEILNTLFFHEMNERNEDLFVLGKGHGCLALYSALTRKGLLDRREWKRIGTPEGILGGHPTKGRVPGIEISTGSLGLSPSVAVGWATQAKRKKTERRVFCVLGDGECNEGSVWEAALSASQKKLNNLFFLIDCNGQQAYGKTSEVCSMDPWLEKWGAFGFAAYEVDLKSEPTSLMELFSARDFPGDRPVAIICRTTKGMGLSHVEDDPVWHSKTKLTDAEKERLRGSVGL